jgi:hypothetical protein
MGRERKRPSFETPRKRAAPQDDAFICGSPGHDEDYRTPA